MKQINKLIEGKQCYIVPGRVSEVDIKLSIALAIPILTGPPADVKMFSTKSGAKRIFQIADIPIPIGSHDIFNKDEFFDRLTRLIAENLYINTWIFKIDDEYNGRGHASINMIDFKTISALRKNKVKMTEAITEKLKDVIIKTLPKKVKIAQPSLFRTWD